MLCHMQVLSARRPEVFADEITQLFCRYNEPSYVKSLRLELITHVCDERSFPLVRGQRVAVALCPVCMALLHAVLSMILACGCGGVVACAPVASV